jgi:outer membrane protein insertion porin family
VCALGLGCIEATAQVQQLEGRRIVDIQFSPSAPLAASDLMKAQPLKKGEPLRAADVGRAIDGLFATGRFDDVLVEGEAAQGGVIVRFITKPKWFVGGVSVDSKVLTDPNRAQISSAAGFSLGAPYHEEDLTHATANILRLLRANGFYRATVTPGTERDNEAQQVFITFRVKEGKRAKYEKPILQHDDNLSDRAILRATGWRFPIIHWWRHVTDSRTHKGIQAVLGKYQGQDRLLARVELKSLDYDAAGRGVRATLAITPGPKVEVKSVEAHLSRKVLKRYVPVFAQRAVDTDLLVEGKRNLTDYLQNQGYYDAQVDFRVLPPQKDVQTIEYVISRGQRYKLVQVDITGNKYFDTESIRERMFLQPAAFLRLPRGRYSEAFRQKDEENISNLYRANGFRDVKVTSVVDRNYKGRSGDVAVMVNIQEGPQWFVDKLSIEGASQLKPEGFEAQLASIAGQPFSDLNIAADRNSVLSYYYSHGFPAASFDPTWRENRTPHHVDLVYRIAEGDRQYVRKVLTSGLRTTNRHLVDRNITIQAGDPLSVTSQIAIQKRFYELGIFARVDTAIQNPDGDTSSKYVLYHFDEANRYTVAVGVGAQVARFGTPSTSNLSAPAGATGFAPEVSLAVSRLNFLGLGHMITARGLYSSIEKRGSLSYFQPRFRNSEGRNITYTLLFDNTLDVRTFASKREEGSIQLSQKFSKTLTGLFQFSYRRVSVNSVVIPVLLIPQFLQPVRIGMISTNFAYDRRDNPADPHRGIYTSADLGLSAAFLGSQRSFGRALVRNATYYSLTKNIVLARQTQFGVIAPFNSPAGIPAAQSVPLAERFFAGGADSLRAFPYNQAGPRDTGAPLVPGGPASAPTGFPLGGNALFINNIELRFPFIGQNIEGVLFHDMGNVFSSLGNISFRFHQKNSQDFDYMVHAVGFGIRYRTPIGPIRADLAYSINAPSFVGFNGTPAQVLQCNPNVASGLPSYCQPVPQSISHFQFFFSIGQTF